MKRLFIEIYQDEDVDVLIANLLRVRGFRVITTPLKKLSFLENRMPSNWLMR